MFNRVHIEDSSTCNAACPQCPRTTITEFPKAELTLDDFKLYPDEFFKTKKFLFNGNYSDPITCTELPEIIEYIRGKNSNCHIHINTNGSLRTPDFFERLAYNNVEITFAIDGITQESHSRYRKNTFLQKILDNADAFIFAGGKATWKMIVFKHNQEEIDRARHMSQLRRFAKFEYIVSNRFGQVYDSADLEPATIELPIKKDNLKQLISNNSELNIKDTLTLESKEIECESELYNDIFIDMHNRIYPCCWVGGSIFRTENSQRKSSWEPYKLFEKNTSVRELGFKAAYNNHLENMKELYPLWKKKYPYVCRIHCSKPCK